MKEIYQEQEGYCGPAVLQDIIHQEGMFATQSEIADVCRTTNKDGTSHLGLLMGARELGLKVFKVQGLRIDQLADFLPKHYVVVDWMTGDDEAEDGHYEQIEKIENGKIYLIEGEVFDIETFDKKWYDFDKDGVRIDRWAMLVHRRYN